MSGSASLNAYIDDANAIVALVFFSGSTALKRGMGLCYDQDYGTAATAEPSRNNRVELPSITNARFFAGVVLHDHKAVTGGQWVEIAVPGSVCYVLLSGPSVAVGASLVTCQAGGTLAGYFTRAGFQGEGSAVPLQTVNASAAAALCLAKLQVGLPSGLVEVVTPAVGGGATVFMVGGVSYVAAAALTGDATFTMAAGTIEGLRKKFEIEGDLGDSKDLIITVNGVKTDGSTALATLTGDDDNDVAILEWNGAKWKEIFVTGFVIA